MFDEISICRIFTIISRKIGATLVATFDKITIYRVLLFAISDKVIVLLTEFKVC